jgi:hypothetical protein
MTQDEAKAVVKAKYREAYAANFGRKFMEPWSVMLGDRYAFAWRRTEPEAWLAAAEIVVEETATASR